MRSSDSRQTFVHRVAIVGLANAGKSTLLNALVGQRVSITSAKCQTTRRALLAAWMNPQRTHQALFWDTPGMMPKSVALRVDSRVQRAALELPTGAGAIHRIWWVVDASQTATDLGNLLSAMRGLKSSTSSNNALTDGDSDNNTDNNVVSTRPFNGAAEAVFGHGLPVTLVLSKCDVSTATAGGKLNALTQALVERAGGAIDRVFCTAALRGRLGGLREHMLRDAPPGRLLNLDNLDSNSDTLEPTTSSSTPMVASSQSLLERVCEIVREKFYRRLNRQLPYSLRIQCAHWLEHPLESESNTTGIDGASTLKPETVLELVFHVHVREKPSIVRSILDCRIRCFSSSNCYCREWSSA